MCGGFSGLSSEEILQPLFECIIAEFNSFVEFGQLLVDLGRHGGLQLGQQGEIFFAPGNLKEIYDLS